MRAALASDWWATALAVAGGLLLVWLALVLTLYLVGRRTGEPTTLREAVRLLPDVLVLVRRLAGDDALSRGVRWRLLLLLGYLAFPVDLVPDFIPVAGYADDALLVAWVLRSVVRVAGPEALERHWPGTPQGLATVRRLAGIDRTRTSVPPVPRLQPQDPAAVAEAIARSVRTKADLRLLSKHFLALLAQRAPGKSVEVRVPPYAAAQVVEGVRHTRGTPPAVIELDAEVWIALATGETTWASAVEQGRVRASGERADLSPYLPLTA